jgi:hypothetical protein
MNWKEKKLNSGAGKMKNRTQGDGTTKNRKTRR